MLHLRVGLHDVRTWKISRHESETFKASRSVPRLRVFLYLDV
ncbi:conserved hypothetical protein [Pseudomonas sp. P14-2025]